ncbi:MAG: cytochrome C [Candidatus Eisenbacteria bacterium]|nr:cytochrome C [Candidatus Eisenbacteria bacterium]
MAERKLPGAYYNWISIIGAAIAGLSLLLIILFFGISMFLDFAENPYLGIIQFLLLPAVFLVGLVIIQLGAFITRRRQRRGIRADQPSWPVVDLNKRSHRNAVITFAVGSVLVVFVSTTIGYQALHYSESVEFCGLTCHEVMKPEYVAYNNSPHARVPCVDCHIGPGADWFVKSKLSGAYQVYATIANKYPKPIPTPIENLRPAQETCEQCHWPKQFFGAQQRRFNHFMYDEDNSRWPINMLIKTGGGDPQTGQAQGIHWHMNIGFKVEYVARDERRQDIPWVRTTERATGRVTVYQDEDDPLSDEELAELEPRLMDCMDCHNRPSHIYHTPDETVDAALLTRRIARDLPSIKEVAVDVMEEEYATTEAAMHGIASGIGSFYELEHPELYAAREADVEAAILVVQDLFSKNIFPEMKVRWSAYPENIGHFTSPGCDRCHNTNLVSSGGKQITTDCNACHTIIAQGEGDRRMAATTEEGLAFVHPVDIGEAWREVGCYECHTGVQP